LIAVGPIAPWQPAEVSLISVSIILMYLSAANKFVVVVVVVRSVVISRKLHSTQHQPIVTIEH